MTHEQRDRMYDYFQRNVLSKLECYDLRGEWKKQIKRRITQIICASSKAKKRPGWMPQTHWAKLKRMADNPNFVKYSETNKTNRRSGEKDGKAIGTHTLGRKNSVVAFKEIGPDATPYRLMEKSKKDKCGNWVCPRASETGAVYTREMNRPIPEG